MDRKKLRKEITFLIDSIKEHSDLITPHDRIPQLELELILSKIKKLYEKSIVFNYLNELDTQSKDINSAKTPVNVIELQEYEVVEVTEIPSPESLTAEPEFKTEPLAKEIKPDLNTKLKDKPLASLNEQIAKSGNSSILSNKLQKKPLTDLYKAIGINERFLFTKELFKGDSNKFKKTVDKLNSLSSYNDAQEYISQNLSELEWDFKHPTVTNFIELVERRFL